MADWAKHYLLEADSITIKSDGHTWEMDGPDFVRCLESPGWIFIPHTTFSMPMNVNDGLMLRRHMIDGHRSLFDPVAGGPISSPADTLLLPDRMIGALHTANHMQPWRDHHIDNWRA